MHVSMYDSMCIHVCLCACVYVYLPVSMCAGVSAHVCICVCVCVWCTKYKICIFGLYDTKSAKCESDTVSVIICVYLYNVCVVPNIKLVSLVCMYEPKIAKCKI